MDGDVINYWIRRVSIMNKDNNNQQWSNTNDTNKDNKGSQWTEGANTKDNKDMPNKPK